MSKTLKTFIPSNDDTGDWFATVNRTAPSGEFFKVEAVRKIEPDQAFKAFKTRSRSPFENSVFPCFLNFGRKGTLGNVEVIGQGVGEAGPDVVFETQSVEAEAKYILFGEGFDIDHLAAYAAVTFLPSGLRPWVKGVENRPLPDHFSSSSTEIESFDLAGIGKLRVFFAHEGAIGIGSETKTFTPYVSIEFDHPRSFVQIDSICSLLDSLFSFLTMTAIEPTELKLTPSGEHPDMIRDHTLLRSGIQWNIKSDRSMFSNFLSVKDVPSIKTIICDMMNAYGEASLILEAINEALHFSENCNKSFGLIFPKLERFLDKWFSGDDETSFQSKEEKFFQYIKASKDEEIIAFCNKHISVKNRKKRGTKQKLRLAIETLNRSLGCDMDVVLAERILEFRTSKFHSSGLTKIFNASENCQEVSRACEFMLIAFTLEVLKIPRETYSPKLKSLFPDLYA
ncbi:hypothetical protein [Ruegeria lacuscaerulensis]|uniref:ApeA N-terminal domain 1-containing protein n=1 Tax=Ruegeria lacuscaerulensis TaxID=55218 RepID=UPI001479F577